MGVILTLGTMIVGILIPVLIMLYTGWDVINFSIMFVVPVGAGIVGYICGYGYFKSLVRAHKKIDKGHYITGAIIALICFLCILYGQYYITCIDASGYVTYSLTGDHISNYIHDDYGPLTFFNYIIYSIETAAVSFSHRSQDLGTVSNATLNYVFFVINIVGIIYGFISNGFSKSEEPYCDKCRKYKKTTLVTDIPLENVDEIVKNIEEASKLNDGGVALKEYLQNYKLNDDLREVEHIEGTIEFCEECKSAVLLLKLYELGKKGKLVLNSDFTKEIPLNFDVAMYYNNLYKNDYEALYVDEKEDDEEVGM